LKKEGKKKKNEERKGVEDKKNANGDGAVPLLSGLILLGELHF
jgi:hypothetical protein